MMGIYIIDWSVWRKIAWGVLVTNWLIDHSVDHCWAAHVSQVPLLLFPSTKSYNLIGCSAVLLCAFVTRGQGIEGLDIYEKKEEDRLSSYPRPVKEIWTVWDNNKYTLTWKWKLLLISAFLPNFLPEANWKMVWNSSLRWQVRPWKQVMLSVRSRLIRLWLPWNPATMGSWQRYWWVSLPLLLFKGRNWWKVLCFRHMIYEKYLALCNLGSGLQTWLWSEICWCFRR